jgi:hypothetical protein
MSKSEPITPPDKEKDTRSKLRGLSLLIIGLTVLTGLAALAASLYFFLGFAENDSQPGVLLSAFLLCFGVGALGYIPMFWIATIAYRVRRNGRSRSALILTLALIIPWVIFAIILLATGWPLALFGAGLAALSTLILTWAWALVREN